MAVNRVSRSAAVLCALSLLVLSACGSGAMGGLAAGLKRAKPVDLNTVSRKSIEGFGAPILRASVPARGIDVLMSIREQKGNVVTWEAADGFTVTFRDGVLIETRGLGADMMSARAPSAGGIAAGAVFSRSYFYLGDEDATQRRDYTCTPQTIGAAAITIYGRSHQTRQVAELCQRSQGKVTNQFWFEGSTLRQSQQWVSPAIGYAVFARVID